MSTSASVWVCAVAEAPEMSSAASSCPRMSKIGAAEQVGMLDGVRPLALIGIQRVGRETAAPRAPYDLIDRQPRPVSGEDTVDQVRVALGVQARLHGVSPERSSGVPSVGARSSPPHP